MASMESSCRESRTFALKRLLPKALYVLAFILFVDAKPKWLPKRAQEPSGGREVPSGTPLPRRELPLQRRGDPTAEPAVSARPRATSRPSMRWNRSALITVAILRANGRSMREGGRGSQPRPSDFLLARVTAAAAAHEGVRGRVVAPVPLHAGSRMLVHHRSPRRSRHDAAGRRWAGRRPSCGRRSLRGGGRGRLKLIPMHAVIGYRILRSAAVNVRLRRGRGIGGNRHTTGQNQQRGVSHSTSPIHSVPEITPARRRLAMTLSKIGNRPHKSESRRTFSSRPESHGAWLPMGSAQARKAPILGLQSKRGAPGRARARIS